MDRSEIFERVELLEKLGALIRRGAKAHGLITAVWGAAVLAGFSIFQAVELVGLPWYYGVASLSASLGAAGALTGYLESRGRGAGYAGRGWLGRRLRAAWAMVVLGGGVAYMLVFWSPKVSQAIFSALHPEEVSGLILTGWLIIDGVGCVVQGAILESKAYQCVGLSMCGAAILVAYVGFVYAWAAFALTLGLGYLLVGLRDYFEFKRSKAEGVEVGGS